MSRTAAAVTLLLASACVPSEGPSMRPFQDCNASGCHASGGEGRSWTAAGTWAKGTAITLTGANGKTVVLHGNEAGNFYTAEPLGASFTVSVNGKVMPDWNDPTKPAQLTYGGCNMCHRAEQVTMTFGPEMLPGSDCLACHSPTGMASGHPFSAAGTFPNDRGATVQVGSQTATINAVGNFYISAPIAWGAGLHPRVGGSTMEPATTDGSCNHCHVNGHASDGD